MRYDYISLLQDNGFVFPKNESSFDVKSMTETTDNRIKNIMSLLTVSLHGMRPIKTDDKRLIFESSTKKQYEVKIKGDSLSLKLLDKQGELTAGVQEFVLEKDNEDDNYVFRRVMICNKGIFIVEFIMPPPDSYKSNHMVVMGYDNYVKENMDVTDDTYDNILRKLLDETGILPDLHRKITVSGKDYCKSTIQEVDLLLDDNIQINSSTVNSVSGRMPDFVMLESYIRQRDYETELVMMDGLPFMLKLDN